MLHLEVTAPDSALAGSGEVPARVGLVVSKAVGPSVVRSRVKRRLRHVMRDRLQMLPSSSILVIRAQPAAAGATSQELAVDLDRCLSKVLGSIGQGTDQL